MPWSRWCGQTESWSQYVLFAHERHCYGRSDDNSATTMHYNGWRERERERDLYPTVASETKKV